MEKAESDIRTGVRPIRANTWQRPLNERRMATEKHDFRIGTDVPARMRLADSGGGAWSWLCESRPAVAATARWARGAVGDFAAAAGLSEERLDDVRLVVSEAVTNAIVHAYGDGSGEVHLIAASRPGELLVVVADEGAGMRGGRSERRGLGLGLPTMAALSDGLTVAHRAGGGVEVRMAFSM